MKLNIVSVSLLVLLTTGLTAGLGPGQAPVLAASANPEQDEQIKLKSAIWMGKERKAGELAKAAKYQEAEAIYKQVLGERQALGLDLLTDQDQLGQLYLHWGKIGDAEKIYQEMVAGREKMSGKDSQDVVYPLKQYGACLSKAGKREEGKKVLARANAIQKEIDSTPTFGKITSAAGSPERLAEAAKMRALGEDCLKQNLEPKALIYFNRAIALNANDPETLRDRSQALQFQNRFAQAMQDLNKAIKLKPEFEKAYVSRAYLHDNQEHKDLAIADFKKALTLDPKDTDTLAALAMHLDQQGKHKEAVACFSKIIAIDPNQYYPYVHRAECYANMGDFKSAIADYTTLVDRAPEDPDYHEYRAQTFIKSGDLKSALEDYNKVIATSPGYAGGYRGRATVYEKMDGKKTPRVVADYATLKKMGY